MNIASRNISVFTTTLREGVDPAAKYTTEYNLTSLINKLIDKDAFVIDNNVSVSNFTMGSLDFNIMGYYFSLKDVNLEDLVSSMGTNTIEYINATIKIAEQSYNGTNFKNWYQLTNPIEEEETIDSSKPTTYYKGVELSRNSYTTFDNEAIGDGFQKDGSKNIRTKQESSATFTGNIYKFTILKVFKDLSGNYIFSIPAESKIKFETNKSGSHHSVTIDDGELQ